MVTPNNFLTQAIQSELLPADAAAGVAIFQGDAPQQSVSWIPDSLPTEPAFLIYSITKTFSATLALIFQERGRLSLEAPLANWFPAVPAAERITIRQLLNHTAGIPDYGPLPDYSAALRRHPQTSWTFDDYAAHTWEKGLRYEPGQGWEYSNPGYMLIRSILEATGEASYADLIQSYISQPLGLARTFVAESLADLRDLAPAGSTALSEVGEPRDMRTHYHPGWVAHGVLVSTASETACFLHALFNGRLLNAASLEEMKTAVPVPGAETNGRLQKPSYSLGLMADPDNALGPLFGHHGGGPGYKATAFHRIATNRTVCALCAADQGLPTEEIVFSILSAQ